MKLNFVILAGGMAKRLGKISKQTPKSLIEVSGEPFIFKQLRHLKLQGAQKVILCVGNMGEKIKKKVGNGSKFGLDISYSFDGPTLLGTGGALKKALPKLDRAFFVLYGDSFLPINFNLVEEAFFKSKHPALMTVMKNENQWDKSNVSLKKNNLIDYNKNSPDKSMDYIDYGLGVLTKEVFANIRKETFDLSEIYRNLSKELKLEGYIVSNRFYEIGSYEGLQATRNFFLKEGDNIELCKTTFK